MTDSYVPTKALLALIRRVFKALLIITIVVGALGITIGTIAFATPGLWAALIASIIGIIFTATTVLGLYYAAGRGQEALMIVILGGWLVKIIILGGIMLWLKSQTFYHKGTFVATIVTLVLVALIVEMVMVATARIPYVDVSSVTAREGGGGAPSPAKPAQPQQNAESEESSAPREATEDGGV